MMIMIFLFLIMIIMIIVIIIIYINIYIYSISLDISQYISQQEVYVRYPSVCHLYGAVLHGVFASKAIINVTSLKNAWFQDIASTCCANFSSLHILPTLETNASSCPRKFCFALEKDLTLPLFSRGHLPTALRCKCSLFL